MNINEAADWIAQGHLLAFPTETVYGLGADAAQKEAVEKIFAAKGRPSDHPLIVHVHSAQAAIKFASSIPVFAEKLIAAFWPGPLTLILPRLQEVGKEAAGGQDSIGLRCPSHPIAQDLLKACLERGVWGVAAPSANKFGKVSPTTAAHVRQEFESEIADGKIALLDGGSCEVGIESTIIDCTRSTPVLLRPGQLSRSEIEAVLGCKLLSNEELLAHDLQAKNAPKSSGNLASHYAPRAKLRLMDAKALQTAIDVLGQEAKNIAIYAQSTLKIHSNQMLFRRMPEDAAACAQQLFAVLREFDAQNVKLIWVQEPPERPEWEGVRDRLHRAAA